MEKTSRGLLFEEFEVGHRATSPARTITESDIVQFAGLTGDYNPLHTDALHAATSMFGQRIAHGLLGLSVSSGLTWRLGWIEGTALAFLDLEWKFRAPILIGDTIRVEIEIADKRLATRLGGGIVTFDVRVLNQDDDVTQKGTWRLLIRSGDTTD